MANKKRVEIKLNPLIISMMGIDNHKALRIISNTINRKCEPSDTVPIQPKKCVIKVSLDEDGIENMNTLKKQKGARMHQICEIILIENFLKQFRKSD